MGLADCACTLVRSVFTNNTLTDNGGGISGGTVAGGALYTYQGSTSYTIRIRRCTFKVGRVL